MSTMQLERHSPPASTHPGRPGSSDRRVLGRGAPLVVDEGCDVRIGGRVAGPALRQALLAWLPLTTAELEVYEGGLFADEPANAVALLVRPPMVWSLDDAVATERAFPRSARFDPGRCAALEEHARIRVTSAHLRRLRESAGQIGRRLPCPGLPTASATVAAGCSAVAADDELCATVAARQLARYATSALVARATAKFLHAAATVGSS